MRVDIPPLYISLDVILLITQNSCFLLKVYLHFPAKTLSFSVKHVGDMYLERKQ